VPNSELVFGTLTQNRSSLEPSLEFAAAIAGTPRIENGGTFAVDFADGRRDGHNIDVRPDGPQPIQEKAQDYPGFGLKSQTPTPKSAQLTSLAPARAAAKRRAATRVARLSLIRKPNEREFLTPLLASQQILVGVRETMGMGEVVREHGVVDMHLEHYPYALVFDQDNTDVFIDLKIGKAWLARNRRFLMELLTIGGAC
jgi:hypothetical protein